MPENQVARGIGVYGAVLTHGVQPRGVRVECHGGDAVGAADVIRGLGSERKGLWPGIARVADIPRVPEFNGGVRLRGGKKEVGLARVKPLDGCDGRRVVVLVLAGVCRPDGVDGVSEVRGGRFGEDGSVRRHENFLRYGAGSSLVPRVPDLNLARPVRRSEYVAAGITRLELHLPQTALVASREIDEGALSHNVQNPGTPVSGSGGQMCPCGGPVEVHDGVGVSLPKIPGFYFTVRSCDEADVSFLVANRCYCFPLGCSKKC